MTDYAAQIEALREAIRTARSMPMSASAVVNRQELLDDLDRLEASFSAALAESNDVLNHRDAVIVEGEGSAAEIVRQARLEQDRLVSDTEVFRLAQRKAEETLADARSEAESLRRDAEAYIEQRFASFEHSLERTLAEVRRGIANLAGRTEFDDAQTPAGPAPAAPDTDGKGDVLLADPEAG
jgi:hypothetical protein